MKQLGILDIFPVKIKNGLQKYKSYSLVILGISGDGSHQHIDKGKRVKRLLTNIKVLMIFLAAVTLVLFLAYKPLHERALRGECQHYLRCVAFEIYTYQKGFLLENPTNNFPNLWNLEGGAVRHLFTCPGTGKKRIPSSPEDMDYIFIDWSRWFKDPKKIPDNYPLGYDRRLSNHAGKGINIVFVGNPNHLMWDKKAEWLKRFAIDHPDYQIKLPE